MCARRAAAAGSAGGQLPRVRLVRVFWKYLGENPARLVRVLGVGLHAIGNAKWQAGRWPAYTTASMH